MVDVFNIALYSRRGRIFPDRRDVAIDRPGFHRDEQAARRMVQDRFADRSVQPACERLLVAMAENDQVGIHFPRRSIWSVELP